MFSIILIFSLIAPCGALVVHADVKSEASSDGTDSGGTDDPEAAASSDDETSDMQTAEADISSWEGLQASIDAGEGKVSFELPADISAGEGAKPITIKKGRNVTIDLHGHTINRGLSVDTPDGEVIRVEGGGTLILTDSTDTPGTITGGANTGNGGGVLCDDNAALTVTGGVKIVNNRASNGAGIYLGAACELYLGTCAITDNSCSVFGGGIYGGSSHVTFLGGLTRVNNNYKGDDDSDQNDLYIPAEMEKLRFWYVTGAGTKREKEVYAEELKRGSGIGILLEERAKEISEGYGECNQVEASLFFFYDKDDLEVSDDPTKSEITIIRTEKGLQATSKSTLEVYKGGKLKSTEQFDSFISAFKKGADADGDEKIVTMGSDYSSDEQILLEENKSVVIDLNGHTIKRNREGETKRYGGVIYVESGATLTIRDSSPKKKGYQGIKGGVITGGASSNGGGGITVEEEAHLVMEGGTIYECISDYSGGGVYVDTGSWDTTFIMRGGRITSCRAVDSMDDVYGGAVYFGEGRLDLKDARIDGCYSEDEGGAIYCLKGEVYLENMIFSTNKTLQNGGAIYINLTTRTDGNLFFARGCSFIENEASGYGGAFYSYNMIDRSKHKGAAMLDHCIFRGNSAVKDGGALFVCNNGMVLSNVEITDNTADRYGGGVYVDGGYTVTVKGVVVIKNNRSKKGANTRDLCLEANTAYINSAGLSYGSWIGIGSTINEGIGPKRKENIMLSDNMSVYEMKYFHPQTGSISAKNVKEVEVEMVVTGSLFSAGNIVLIAVMSGIGILLIVLLIVRKRYIGRGGRL